MSPFTRQTLSEAKKIVIKVGSQALIDHPLLTFKMAEQIHALMREGRSVVLVSSGAVAFGRGKLKMDTRPKDVHLLQAVAAVGQSSLMHAFEESFALFERQTAQILFTHSIFSDRNHYRNAKATIEALFELRAVPIINENDSVTAEEIGFGDNDQLAAMTSTLIEADALVLLTNVDGLLDEHGNVVHQIDEIEDAARMIQTKKSSDGLGGMTSKLLAADRANMNGTSVIIANASEDMIVPRILKGENVGTFFPASESPLSRRKHWIAFTLHTAGVLTIDAGAEKALLMDKTSLLPIGVVKVDGDFQKGDAVSIQNEQGLEIAKGLCRYSSEEASRIIKTPANKIKEVLGWHGGSTIVHRDDMVFETTPFSKLV